MLNGKLKRLHTMLNGKLKRLHTMQHVMLITRESVHKLKKTKQRNVMLSTRESVHKLKKTKQRKIGKRNVQQARIKDRRFLIKRDLQ